MYAVIQIGSTQFKVSEGDTITSNLLDSEEGKSLTLNQVLLYVDGNDVRVGVPILKDIKVTAKVIKHSLGEKLMAFKSRPRKNYARRVGHRAKTTILNITKISTK